MAARRHDARRPDGRGRRGARRARGEDGQAARRRRRPAARVGALGRAVLDAGDDGHRPQPRAQRRVGRRAWRKQTGNERFAYDSYRRFVQMFGKIVLDIDGDEFEQALDELREERGVATDPELVGRGPARARRARSRRSCCAEAGIEFPQDPHGAARATRSRPCSGRGTASAARDLPPDGEDPRRPRHRGQRADDGVRQQGRRLRHRRRVHARPGDRREPARTATSCATRRARTSSPASASPSRSTRWATTFPECHQQLLERDADARRTTTATCATSSSRSSRVACSSSRPASASAPRRPRCAWPSRWRARASSTSARRCCACSRRSSTSSCTRSSTRRRSTRRSPRG